MNAPVITDYGYLPLGLSKLLRSAIQIHQGEGA